MAYTILDRAVETITIAGTGVDMTHMVFAKGNVSIKSAESVTDLADFEQLQRGSVVSFEIKGTELLSSGLARDYTINTFSTSTAAGTAMTSPTVWTPVQDNQISLKAEPVIFTDAAAQMHVVNKNVTFSANSMYTNTAAISGADNLLAQVLTYQLMTLQGDTFYLVGARGTYMIDAPFTAGDQGYIQIKGQLNVPKISGGLTNNRGVVLPSNLSIIGALETIESAASPVNITLACTDGSVHTLSNVLIAVGADMDFSYNATPTINITGSKRVIHLGDIYTLTV